MFITLGVLTVFGSCFCFITPEVECIGVSVTISHGMMYEINFSLDKYSEMFGAVVGVISGSVLIFSSFYMEDELFKKRFCSMILLFVGSMVLLLIADNLVTLMVGWDGLGLTSFCLVGYYDSKSSLSASMLTLMTNRVGDVMLLVAISVLMGTTSLSLSNVKEYSMTALMFMLVLVACATKSAQVPFSAWLPAAMAAPTPVSTLVHSSTLVTAGLYVMFRFSGSLMSGTSSVMFLMGLSTALMASSCAILEADIKKVVALSTLSQLGVMNMGLSIGMGDLAFFHLIVHALFKALMFMCVGCVIMGEYGGQEVRRISGLSFKMPMVSMWLLVACVSLSGFPMMAGFFSKDLLLEALISEGMSVPCLVLVLVLSLLTVCYSWRLVKCMFFSKGSSVASYVGEPKAAFLCTFMLGMGSVVGAMSVQMKMMEVNGLALVSYADKVLLSIVVAMGALIFSFITPAHYISSGRVKEALSTMVFFGVVSGSPIAKLFLKLFMECGPSAEAGLEYYFGEGMVRRSVKSSFAVSGVPLHWGAWGFFVYYVGLIISLFLVVAWMIT
uniref:NADH dehydrogenase subunit 5 n=1 Tax=Hippopus porcellanus TaxID=80819 RepID=UPI00226C767D|nr:NADH dehydrogenase subunit 5 [Hippopus porcellanus]UZM09093.1 NADH dehydrogenase subunit 5 [Hippopus porcellanus]